jgi:anti-sigma-K factor RskA
MTPADDREREHGGDDLLAAEYVLGVLPAAERQETAARIESDAAFALLVEAWEDRLSPLNAGYDEVEAPAAIKTSIDARLFGAPIQVSAARPGLLQSLTFWRGLAAAAVAAFLLVMALPIMLPPAAIEPAERLMASLASEETDVRYLVLYDAASGQVGLSHVTGEPEAAHDFELWVIEGDSAPVSLGVIPAGANVHMGTSPQQREMIASGALFAISMEPEGGSPTGQPTGPVVAAGDLRSI